jgi:uncharacterized repeat protein (TIGR01451 family)
MKHRSLRPDERAISGRSLSHRFRRISRLTNMNVCRCIVIALLASHLTLVRADPVPLFTDVSVTMTATPAANLVPGQQVQFTVTVTNLGPVPIQQPIAITSSNIVGDVLSNGSSDCGILPIVVDLRTGGSYYYLLWEVFGQSEAPNFAVGDSVSCHISESITPQTPPIFDFSMGLDPYWSDIDPSNNSATVALQPAPIPTPALSTWALLLLTGLVVLAGAFGHARRRARLIC